MGLLAFILLGWCIVSETIEQLLYRGAGDRHRRVVRYGLFIGPAIALHVIRVAMWLAVLKYIPLGIALPLLGANYAAIAIGGWLVFHERMDRRRVVGIALVVLGFVLVSTSGMGAP